MGVPGSCSCTLYILPKNQSIFSFCGIGLAVRSLKLPSVIGLERIPVDLEGDKDLWELVNGVSIGFNTTNISQQWSTGNCQLY